MASPKDIKILIVDDEEELRNAIGARFRVFGFTILTAESGNKAWDLLQENEVQIVISDIRMQNGSGVELLQKIRERNLEFPKVFLITGYTDFSFADVYGLGADGIFNKPFDSKLLMDTVRNSILSAEERWRSDEKQDVEISLNGLFDSIDGDLEEKTVLLGRGGFFLPLGDEVTQISSDKPIDFDFDFETGGLSKLAGSGIVRWKRVDDEKGVRGIGVEIVTLDDSSRQNVIGYLKERISSGNKEQNIPVIPQAKA